MWAMCAQLLKERNVVYDEREEWCFKMKSGVLQGGVLSPDMFNLTLDHIINLDMNSKYLISSEKLVAFADDLLLSVLPEEIYRVRRLMEHMKNCGLSKGSESNT